MRLKRTPGLLKKSRRRFWTGFFFFFWGGWGGGGDDDDSVAQTHQTVSPQEPFYSVFTVLFVMSDHLI